MLLLREKCRNCGLPLHWVDGVGWLHGLVTSSWSGKDVGCEQAIPWCPFEDCTHGDQDPPHACGCRCHPRPRLPSRKHRRRKTGD